MSKFQIKLVSPVALDVREMIALLNESTLALYEPQDCYFDPPEVLARENCRMVGAYDGDRICGIGAVKFFDGYGEIKRMFVRPEYRGRGVANLILCRLVEFLREEGIPVARLETGWKHEAAVSLYAKHGFKERGPFGDYPGEGASVFMELTV